MSKKYWRKKAERLEAEKESNEQISGCLALIFFIVSMIVIGFIMK